MLFYDAKGRKQKNFTSRLGSVGLEEIEEIEEIIIPYFCPVTLHCICDSAQAFGVEAPKSAGRRELGSMYNVLCQPADYARNCPDAFDRDLPGPD